MSKIKRFISNLKSAVKYIVQNMLETKTLQIHLESFMVVMSYNVTALNTKYYISKDCGYHNQSQSK